ncbi:hypothetical protein HK097_002743 [Rhizophlyctis rosea]|uniref:HNH nuclease domain-containing protein n=1 Tax=Rhizophlyctis rosea TaxID=64517 RepID=A0AAD5WY93_9FUNG|nr:hypothetical protein HK097_002743 [Rhizophlyctis rosea]
MLLAAATAVGITKPRNHIEDKKTFQAKFKAACMIRDRCCVVTGTPMKLEAAHVLSPPFAEIYKQYLRREPTVKKVTGPVDYTPTYDVGNGIMLAEGIHRSYNNFDFSIWNDNGQLRTFVFKPCDVPHNSPIIMPQTLSVKKWEKNYVDRFPHSNLFEEHLKEAILRHLLAAGEGKEGDGGEEGQERVVSAGSEVEEEEYAGMSVEDKALNRAWASGDTLVEDDFFC